MPCLPYTQTLRSILDTIYPTIYQKPVLERIDICNELFGYPFSWTPKADDIYLVLTADEGKNIFLYRGQILPSIFRNCGLTIPYFPHELDGYHLLLTRVLYNYSDQLKVPCACRSPRGLIILCLQSWVIYPPNLSFTISYADNPYRRLQPGEKVSERGSDRKLAPIRILARALHAAGVDLLQFGREEASLLSKGLVDQDIIFLHSHDPWDMVTVRLIGFSYGPKPEDWHCWFSDYRDEYAGEFWDMVENAEPELRLPGAWVD